VQRVWELRGDAWGEVRGVLPAERGAEEGFISEPRARARVDREKPLEDLSGEGQEEIRGTDAEILEMEGGG